MTTAVASNTLALAGDWLNASNTVQLSSNLSGGNAAGYSSGYCVGDYWYPYLQPIYRPTYVLSGQPKLRLKLSEVERLREAARGDEALRATLNKFTPYIEVEVDF